MPTLAILPGALALTGRAIFASATRRGFYIQDPRFMSFERWAATVTSDNNLLPVPIQESRWKEWASRIYQITGNTPDPVNYTEWRKWAMDWLAST